MAKSTDLSPGFFKMRAWWMAEAGTGEHSVLAWTGRMSEAVRCMGTSFAFNTTLHMMEGAMLYHAMAIMMRDFGERSWTSYKFGREFSSAELYALNG